MGDTIFIFCLALILFGPKKLPEIGRQIGKLMVEFRRASNEFKMQIEEELRSAEEAERQKEINAAKTMLPTSTPAAPSIPAETVESSAATTSTTSAAAADATPVIAPPSTGLPVNHTFSSSETAGNEAIPEMSSPELASKEAYPEPANGFNAGLNTASNGLIAETPASAIPTQPEAVEVNVMETAKSELSDPEPEQAPVHHG